MAKFIRSNGPFKGKSLVGEIFDRWSVLRFVGYFIQTDNHPVAAWLCRCRCGKYGIRNGSILRIGATRSCGCLSKDCRIGRLRHGETGTPLNKKWVSMISRCTRKSAGKSWEDYGGRGIKVCDRWLVYENFRDDMAPTYKPGLSLERIDNNGNYEPTNCRWATDKEQANNRRSNLLITFRGETLTSSQWQDRTGIKGGTIRKRLHDGWSVELSLTTPTGLNGRASTVWLSPHDAALGINDLKSKLIIPQESLGARLKDTDSFDYSI